MSIDNATPTEWNDVCKPTAKPYVDPYDIQPTTPVLNDPVNRPAHYNTGTIECIDYLRDSLGEGFSAYLEGSVKKYLHRYRYKNKPVEDLRKAKWYIDRLIQEQLNADE